MKTLDLYNPGGTFRETFEKGKKRNEIEGIVEDIKIVEEGVIIKYGYRTLELFSGFPYIYKEMNESGDSFYNKVKK